MFAGAEVFSTGPLSVGDFSVGFSGYGEPGYGNFFDDDFEVEQEAAIIKISTTLSGVKLFAFMVVGLS